LHNIANEKPMGIEKQEIPHDSFVKKHKDIASLYTSTGG
jgi:hypothetical protein